jgi:hypothetical protein
MMVMVRISASWNDVQIAEPNASLSDDGIREGLYVVDGPFQYRHFQTVLMIDMDVKGGNRQIAVMMLGAGKASREIADVVLEDIGQGRKTWRCAIDHRPVSRDGISDDIAYGLGPASITAPFT